MLMLATRVAWRAHERWDPRRSFRQGISECPDCRPTTLLRQHLVRRFNRRSKEIVELLLQAFRDEAWKEELRQIERRRAELETTIAAAKSEPIQPALHPNMAQVFERKIGHLAAALGVDDPEQREAARQTLRGFIDHIVIPPGDALLQVVGNFGEMLSAADGRRRSVGNDGCGGGI
jgi:site-specific DNA recombinase